MPRIRKESNRYWVKKDKLKIINEVVIDEFSSMKYQKNMIFQMKCYVDG